MQAALDTMEEKMMKTIEFVHSEFATVRTGKASTSLVENIQVETYGTHMRLRELAGISTPEPRLIVIQPWDTSVVQAVVSAIQKSELGINPMVDGKIIRIPIPELSEERRRDLAKTVKQLAEESRVRIRSCRRSAMEAAKKLQKDGDLTEDGLRDTEAEIQKLTDRFVADLDKHTANKEAELMKI